LKKTNWVKLIFLVEGLILQYGQSIFSFENPTRPDMPKVVLIYCGEKKRDHVSCLVLASNF